MRENPNEGFEIDAGLFTVSCGKDLNFPSSDTAGIKRPIVQAGSTRSFLRRCIDGKTPNDSDSRGDIVFSGSGGQCRGVPQAELPAHVPAHAGLRDEGDLLSARASVPAQSEVLQDQDLPAEVLPQAEVCPGRSGLRDARAGRVLLSSGLATDLGSALTANVSPILYDQLWNDDSFLIVDRDQATPAGARRTAAAPAWGIPRVGRRASRSRVPDRCRERSRSTVRRVL